MHSASRHHRRWLGGTAHHAGQPARYGHFETRYWPSIGHLPIPYFIFKGNITRAVYSYVTVKLRIFAPTAILCAKSVSRLEYVCLQVKLAATGCAEPFRLWLVRLACSLVTRRVGPCLVVRLVCSARRVVVSGYGWYG